MAAASSPSSPFTEPFALYVHWPWCLSKCPYCDFNSRALTPEPRDQADYRDAILRELEYYAEQTNAVGPGRGLGSIFFGGGTPSLMAPDTVHAIIAAAKDHWGFQSDCEITLEANPTSIEAAKFRAFQDAGVNRVSIGVQALNDEDLHALGREHSAEEALRALDIASAIFDRYTFDLIYARPGQGQGDWADELEHALTLTNGHISLYQLTIEPGTAFFRQNRLEADEDLAVDLYQITQELCNDAGLPAYEISNHAKPGFESRHNITYWTGGDYIGIGPGAHGRLTNPPAHAHAQTHAHAHAHGCAVTRATHQIADPARWLDAVNTQGHATAKVRELSRFERLEELVLSGLRLTEGLNAARFEALCGQDLLSALNGDAVLELQNANLIEVDDRGVRATEGGRLILNALISRLLDDPDPRNAPT